LLCPSKVTGPVHIMFSPALTEPAVNCRVQIQQSYVHGHYINLNIKF